MNLSSFSAFALTREEMKNVVGGSVYCGCTRNKSGASISIEYYSSTDYCSNPSAGAASATYSYKGKSTSVYMTSSQAASFCGYVSSKPKQYT